MGKGKKEGAETRKVMRDAVPLVGFSPPGLDGAVGPA